MGGRVWMVRICLWVCEFCAWTYSMIDLLFTHFFCASVSLVVMFKYFALRAC